MSAVRNRNASESRTASSSSMTCTMGLDGVADVIFIHLAKRELVVSTAATRDDMVTIAVSDTGSGISSEVAEHLFQPFITSKRHGMGVGLSISRTIIESHGGQIWTDENPGGGTIFRFTVRKVSKNDIGDAV
jgi:signal transduction histidine kinase